MEFSRQEYWSGWPFPPSGGFPDPGIKPGPPALQADSLPSEPAGKPCSLADRITGIQRQVCLTPEPWLSALVMLCFLSLKLTIKLRICHPLVSYSLANSSWEGRAWAQLWVIPIRPHPEWSWPWRRVSLACYPGTLRALPSVYIYCGSLSPPCPGTSSATASDCLMQGFSALATLWGGLGALKKEPGPTLQSSDSIFLVWGPAILFF